MLALAWGTPSPSVADPAIDEAKATDVVVRCFENLYGFSSIQSIDLRVEFVDRPLDRKVQIARRGSTDGLNRMLVYMRYPEDVRGVALLLIERVDYVYDALLYQPIFERIRRISVAQRHDAFFGTLLYFEDLEAKRPRHWSPRFLRSESWRDRSSWVVELTPRDIPSAYEKIVVWFDTELPVFWHAEFYHSGEVHKSLEIEPSHLLESNGHLIPVVMTFTRAGSPPTIVTVSDVRVVDSLPDRLFTRSRLEARRSLDDLLDSGRNSPSGTKGAP